MRSCAPTAGVGFRLHWCVCLRKHKRNSSQRQFSARLCTACRRTVLLLCVVPERRNVRTVKGAQSGFAAAAPSEWTAALVHTGDRGTNCVRTQYVRNEGLRLLS